MVFTASRFVPTYNITINYCNYYYVHTGRTISCKSTSIAKMHNILYLIVACAHEHIILYRYVSRYLRAPSVFVLLNKQECLPIFTYRIILYIIIKCITSYDCQ